MFRNKISTLGTFTYVALFLRYSFSNLNDKIGSSFMVTVTGVYHSIQYNEFRDLIS